MIRRLVNAVLVVLIGAAVVAAQDNPPATQASPPPTTTAETSPAPPPPPPARKPEKPKRLSKKERRERFKELSDKYLEFLTDVEPIMLPDELDAFLRLDSDAQRDLFIENFWAMRDTDYRFGNDYRQDYMERVQEAKQKFGNLSSDRSRTYLLRGRPDEIVAIKNCSNYIQPVEIWYYGYIQEFGSEALFLFYKPRLGVDYRLWQPLGPLGLDDLVSIDGERMGVQQALNQAGAMCQNGDVFLSAVAWSNINQLDVAKVMEQPKVDTEHARQLVRNLVIPNPAAPKLSAKSIVGYSGRRGSRTIVDLSFTVPRSELRPTEINGQKFYDLDVVGEVLRDGRIFESYRYRFDYPAGETTDTIPITVERYLRPAEYTSRVKVSDPNSGAEAILESKLTVPEMKEGAARIEATREGTRAIKIIRDEIQDGKPHLRIVPFPDSIVTGLQQVDAIVTGNAIRQVDFYLDGQKVMSKNDPPWSLNLDMGNVPETRRIKAVGLDAKGNVVAGDEVVINAGTDPFRVRIASPRVISKGAKRARVQIDVRVPEKKKLKEIELWMNDKPVATLYDPPYVQNVSIPNDEIVYLRAQAILDDEAHSSTEDVVFLRKPPFLQQVDVHLIELPTTVLRNGRQVTGLSEKDFTVLDEGKPVKIAKFERVENLPLSVGLAIDTSSSMDPKIAEARRAAAGFLSDVMEKGDRGFVLAFDDHPYLLQKWTGDTKQLGAGLASLRAEGSTALWDAVVYSLYNFQEIKGQKALILLTDGDDTSSTFTYDQAVEYARRSALPIYTIGIGIRSLDHETRSKLSRLASETGGNAWFVSDTANLGEIYQAIETELRSQYLLGFYPPSDVKPGSAWRSVRVTVANATTKTIAGYYP